MKENNNWEVKMKGKNKNTKNKKTNKPAKKMQTKKKYSNNISNKETAQWYDMNQIDWFPIDPYCD